MRKSWYEELFGHIDNRRMDEFLSFLTDDIKLTVANHPTAAGKEWVRVAVGALWQSVNGVKHEFHHVFQDQGHMIFQATVAYTRLDNKVVSVPCVTIIRLEGDLVSEWRIYVDLTPVFALT